MDYGEKRVVVPTVHEYDCVRDYVENAREHGFNVDRLESGDWSEYNNGGFLNHVGEKTLEWLDCLDALTKEEHAAADD